MILRTFHRLSLILLVPAFLIGCDQGRQDLPDVAVRVTNAVPSYGSIDFRREESPASTLGYKNSTESTYDQDQYDFHVEYVPPGATSVERISFSKEVVAEMAYTFVITEDAGGAINPVILEYPTLAATATEAQIVALHAGAALAPMDLYLERPGTNVATAIPKGTLSFNQTIAPRTIATGDYELTLTEPGNPANVLLASSPFTLVAAGSTAFVIVDEADQGVAPLSVLVLQNAGGTLFDKNLQSGLRVINGASDRVARDVAINGQFTPPLFSAVPFAAASDYQLVPPGDNTVNVTPAGNPGVLELTQTIANVQGAKHTLLVAGDSGALTHLLTAEDERRIIDRAKVRFYNVARQFEQVDFFLVPAGTDLATIVPITLSAPGATAPFAFNTGDYELTVRQTGTTTVLAGPQTLHVTVDGLYGVLATNGPDTATAGIALLGDF